MNIIKLILLSIGLFFFPKKDAYLRNDKYVGVTLGPNYGKVTNLNGFWQFGYQTGFYSGYMIRNNIAVEPELFFSMQGFKGFYDRAHKTKKVIIKHKYVEFMPKFKFFLGNNFNLQVSPILGVKIGHQSINLIKIKGEETFTGIKESRAKSKNVNKRYKNKKTSAKKSNKKKYTVLQRYDGSIIPDEFMPKVEEPEETHKKFKNNIFNFGMCGGIGYTIMNNLNVNLICDSGLTKVYGNNNSVSFNQNLKFRIGIGYTF